MGTQRQVKLNYAKCFLWAPFWTLLVTDFSGMVVQKGIAMGSPKNNSESQRQKSNHQAQRTESKPLRGVGIFVVVGIVIVCFLVSIVLFMLGWQRADLVFVGLLFGWGSLLAGLGLKHPSRTSFLLFRFGKYELSGIPVGLALLILGLLAMCFSTYLFVGAFKTHYLEDKEKLILSADEKTLNKAKNLYENAQYDTCLSRLAKVRTLDNGMLEEVQYYTIMARYHSYEVAVRRYYNLPVEDIQRLEDSFKLFMNERPNSKRFDAVQYWLGHLYLQLRNDRESSLQVFDEIIDDYFHSNWIQGSLYYSAILHYGKNTPADKELAIKRLRVLNKVGGPLRIVEVGRDFGAAGCAKELLERWGITAKPKDVDMSKTCADSSQDDQCVPPTDGGEIKSE